MSALHDLDLYVSMDTYDEISTTARNNIVRTHQSLEGLFVAVGRAIKSVYEAIKKMLSKFYNWITGNTTDTVAEVKLDPAEAEKEETITIKLPHAERGGASKYVRSSLLKTGRYVTTIAKVLTDTSKMMKPWVDDLLKNHESIMIDFALRAPIPKLADYKNENLLRGNTIYNSSVYENAIKQLCVAAEIQPTFKPVNFQYPTGNGGDDSRELVKLTNPVVNKGEAIEFTETKQVWNDQIVIMSKVKEKLESFLKPIGAEKAYYKMIEAVEKRHLKSNELVARKKGATDEAVAANIKVVRKGFNAITKRLQRFAGIERRSILTVAILIRQINSAELVIAAKLKG